MQVPCRIRVWPCLEVWGGPSRNQSGERSIWTPTRRHSPQYEGHRFNGHQGPPQMIVVALRLCVGISLYAPNCPRGCDNEILKKKPISAIPFLAMKIMRPHMWCVLLSTFGPLATYTYVVTFPRPLDRHYKYRKCALQT